MARREAIESDCRWADICVVSTVMLVDLVVHAAVTC